MTLTLKQMQDLGMNQYFSDKEVDKQISKALEEQSKAVEKQNCFVYTDIVNYAKEETLEYVIVNGGIYSYKHNGKNVKLSVLTQDDLLLLANIDNLNEQGIEYNLPTKYKFHCMLANGNRLFVRAKDYIEAQDIVNSLLGNNLYKVSSSKI